MDKEDKIIRFSVSLPEELLGELDKMIKTKNYASRSEFTRDLIREKIVQDSWSNEKEDLIGVLSIVYDHHQSGLMTKKMSIEHDANVNIICTNHIHIDHHNCLENMVLKGKAKEVEIFSDRIAGLKGVKFSKLARVAVPKH
ncbi:nickel-responsive transcriptional regulator NikR [Campylobacter hyointestinalis]|uniref:Putative nickel-responsive regulator n=1 Tax=Campylobacter hyointestinalis subsp. lawsonii TaxID=91353 RepID=A0AAV6EES5_CAMHY|nr:nickel-responsive transcriptional regulator NikR [Campylobacter hyointestinalis]KAB0612932.1 nickel-responsive transcriptional regulator NikR [Campylobacter hyointestinalis subsp. lawsonii]QKF69449.1 nickel responsive regulator [Campylobacter hyointestinalis subsp. lawsonii]RAZ27925.1 nickel-responsive transcriptional regulator NikR [Campylobacter hyointestinalis subsp. lawsonii]